MAVGKVTSLLITAVLAGCVTDESLRHENAYLREENRKLRLADREKPPPPQAGQSAEATPTIYAVKHGDLLGSIAQRFYGDQALWERIYQANRELLGDDPDRLKIGMKLVIPALPKKGSGD